MNMHLSIGMHNLDAIHGDEHLSELTDAEVDAIAEEFWQGRAEILGTCSASEMVSGLLSEDDHASSILFELCSTNPDLQSHEARIKDLVRKLTRCAQRLVDDQIHQGNINARDYSER